MAKGCLFSRLGMADWYALSRLSRSAETGSSRPKNQAGAQVETQVRPRQTLTRGRLETN